MKTNETNSKHGFTLIELLVVISIIALLIALLLPSLQKMRYQARTVVCAASLRQVGIGVTAYSVDQRSWYPYNGARDLDELEFSGQYYPNAERPWMIKSNGYFDLEKLLKPYFSSNLGEAFLCAHMKSLWLEKTGSVDPWYMSTGSGGSQVSYAMYFNRVSKNYVDEPMQVAGEGWVPGSYLQNSGVSAKSRIHALASDAVFQWGGNGVVSNHPSPYGPSSQVTSTGRIANGGGSGYISQTPGTGNYLLDDGSVQFYGEIEAYDFDNFVHSRRTRISMPIVPRDAVR